VPHEKIVEEGIIALHEHLFRPQAASAISEPTGNPLSSQL
jgi:shikimate kinase